MTRNTCISVMVLLVVCAPSFNRQSAWPVDELAKRASWTQPTAADVKLQIDQWLSTQELDDSIVAKIEAIWSAAQGPLPGSILLDQLAKTIALVDETARPLVEMCRSERSVHLLPQFDFLDQQQTPPLVRNNLRLLLGRWLAQHYLYDESLAQIIELQPEEVVDPASLLFYQSVVYHCLMDKKKCLPIISRLMENEEQLPRRYASVARLMEADLRPLKTDSLDEVSRLMDDIHRRLGLGRAGTKVRKEEEDVIAKLDKMIEKLEKQLQQQQQQQSSSGGGNRPTSPMQDSNPGGDSGPGKVDPKKIGSKSGWGDLPPKQRQESLQQISKEFPSHFREVIEQYFRKLARDGAKK